MVKINLQKVKVGADISRMIQDLSKFLYYFPVSKAAYLVGGAALLSAIGIVGIASLQGLKVSDEKFNKQMRTADCCKRIQNTLQKLQNTIKDVQENQERLASKQQDLMNLVRHPNNTL